MTWCWLHCGSRRIFYLIRSSYLYMCLLAHSYSGITEFMRLPWLLEANWQDQLYLKSFLSSTNKRLTWKRREKKELVYLLITCRPLVQILLFNLWWGVFLPLFLARGNGFSRNVSASLCKCRVGIGNMLVQNSAENVDSALEINGTYF